MHGKRRVVALVSGVAIAVSGPFVGSVIAQERDQDNQGNDGQTQQMRMQQVEVEVQDFVNALSGTVDDQALDALREQFEEAGVLDEDFVVPGRPINNAGFNDIDGRSDGQDGFSGPIDREADQSQDDEPGNQGSERGLEDDDLRDGSADQDATAGPDAGTEDRDRVEDRVNRLRERFGDLENELGTLLRELARG